MAQRKVRIAHREFALDRENVAQRLATADPESVREHYVVVEGRRFPLKQALSLVTGLDRADFTSHQARRVLSRLGFTVARDSTPVAPREDAVRGRGPHGGREADALRPHMGKWVAQRGLDVLVSKDSPHEVLVWLEQHDEHADEIFRVPATPDESEGVAPA
jgi:hypothetical protein